MNELRMSEKAYFQVAVLNYQITFMYANYRTEICVYLNTHTRISSKNITELWRQQPQEPMFLNKTPKYLRFAAVV